MNLWQMVGIAFFIICVGSDETGGRLLQIGLLVGILYALYLIYSSLDPNAALLIMR